MAIRLPKFAERTFALLASQSGAFANRAEEDENGWDYLMEFPADPATGPADTHPAARKAFVQVKSTKSRRASCRVKLSNALRAAQSPQPWFVVLVRHDKTLDRTTIFAGHVWSGLMARSLKEVRCAENAAKQLHRQFLTISFTDADDHTADLVEWMKRTIAEVGENYEEAKKALYRSLGYEDGYGTGKVTVQAATAEEITFGFLGMGDGLELTHFMYTPARFGIPDPQPLVKGDEGRIFVTPQPVDDCEIRIRSGAETMSVPAKIYSFATPNMSDEDKALRFGAKIFDLVCIGRAKTIKFKSTFNFDAQSDLVSLWRYCTLRAWMAEGATDVQVWARGKRMLAGTLTPDQPHNKNKWKEMSSALSLLRRIAGASEQTVALSLSQFAAAPGSFRLFHSLNDDVNIALEFVPVDDGSEKITSLVWYGHHQVGNTTYCVLVERAVTENTFVEGQRRLICGKPSFVEAYVISDSEDSASLIKADYERYLVERAKVSAPAGLGDIMVFVNDILEERRRGLVRSA
jgi:hypothetical protein